MSTTTIVSLPDLCLLIIFDHVPIQALVRTTTIPLVCRRWASLLHSALARRRTLSVVSGIREQEDHNAHSRAINTEFRFHDHRPLTSAKVSQLLNRWFPTVKDQKRAIQRLEFTTQSENGLSEAGLSSLSRLLTELSQTLVTFRLNINNLLGLAVWKKRSVDPIIKVLKEIGHLPMPGLRTLTLCQVGRSAPPPPVNHSQSSLDHQWSGLQACPGLLRGVTRLELRFPIQLRELAGIADWVERSFSESTTTEDNHWNANCNQLQIVLCARLEETNHHFSDSTTFHPTTLSDELKHLEESGMLTSASRLVPMLARFTGTLALPTMVAVEEEEENDGLQLYSSPILDHCRPWQRQLSRLFTHMTGLTAVRLNRPNVHSSGGSGSRVASLARLAECLSSLHSLTSLWLSTEHYLNADLEPVTTPLPSVRYLCLCLPARVCSSVWRHLTSESSSDAPPPLSSSSLYHDPNLSFDRTPSGLIFPSLTRLALQSECCYQADHTRLDRLARVICHRYGPSFLAQCPRLERVEFISVNKYRPQAFSREQIERRES